MSGIEIAGIALAVIPLVVQGLDSYRYNLRRIGRGLSKRRTLVEKLCRTLLVQSTFLEELVRHVLLSSGCEPPDTFNLHTCVILSSPDMEPDIAEYLAGRYTAFTLMMEQFSETLQNLVSRVAKFVPNHVSAEIDTIMQANRATPKNTLSIGSRISVILNSEGLEDDCRKLEQSFSSIHNLLVLLESNNELGGVNLSGKMKRMAKAFRALQTHASSLFTAVSTSWAPDCHEEHEIKLKLDDRMGELKNANLKKGSADSLHIFELIVVGILSGQQSLWHETAVHISHDTAHDQDDNGDDNGKDGGSKMVVTASQQKVPKVKVAIIAPTADKNARRLQEIDALCAAIQQARQLQQGLQFTLTPRRRLSIRSDTAQRLLPYKHKNSLSLTKVLDRNTDGSSPPPFLSWSKRVNLALLVASNFLQLLGTPWIQTQLSSDAVSFLLQHDSDQLDFSKAFLCLHFGPLSSVTPCSNSQVTDSLLELGIMLLEIWDATTLRKKFSLDIEPAGAERLVKALEWHGLAKTEMPKRYGQAAFHCICGIRGAALGDLCADNIRVWQSVCEKVIDPLQFLAEA